jgi:hypothetical protein
MEQQSDTRGTKVCWVCKRRKRLVAFWRRAACADGRDRLCAECKATYFRTWCAGHRASYNSRHRAYYWRNRERLQEYNREYQRRRRALMRAGTWKTRAKRAR